jgi:hypothetical protein
MLPGTKIAMGALLGALAGCVATSGTATNAPTTPSASQQQVQALKQEYLDKFLTPATAYAYSPRCPQPEGACSTPGIVAELQKDSKEVDDALTAAEQFTDAAPQADASAPLASARAALTAAEAALPGAT